MSKEEFLKIQTCVLKVNIHCDGCKQKVKKILQKIDGVFTTKIDAEAGKVTVSGNVDPAVLIKKLAKSGKHAELWGAPKPNNNSNLPNQFKNMQIENGKGGNNNKNQKGNNNHPKAPVGPPNQQFQQQLQQLQQLQQMKGMQDLKLPQFKGMKLPNDPQNNQQKAVKFAGLPDDDGLSDEFDDDFDDEDDDDYDDEFDDDFDDHQPLSGNKMKPGMVGGGNGLPPAIQNMINAQKGMQNNGAANGKKGGPPGNGAIPVQINMGGGAAKNGGKNGGGNNNNGNHHPQGGKNGGGGKPQEAKNGHNGGGGGKNGNGNGGGGGNNMQGHGGKKGNNGGGGGGGGGVNDGFQKMGGPQPQMGGPQPQMGNMNFPMGNMPMGQLGNMAAVQGLPAPGAPGGGGGPNGYFQGAGPEPMPGNPYQQQYLAAMINQQRAMGNERFQPMMYARPPPAVNYMPPYPYPYPPPPHPHTSDPYTNFFNDENTSSCSVM